MILLTLLFFLIFVLSVLTPKHLSLVTATTFSMFFVSAFGFGLVNVFGYPTNLGTLFFSFTILGLALTYLVHGNEWADEIKLKSLLAILSYTAIMYAIQFIPFINESGLTYFQLFQFGANVFIGSLVGFFASFSVLIYLLEHTKKMSTHWVIFCIGLAHVVDSFIFYPLAFYDVYGIFGLLQLMIGGLILKGLITLSAIPLVFFVIRYKRPKPFMVK